MNTRLLNDHSGGRGQRRRGDGRRKRAPRNQGRERLHGAVTRLIFFFVSWLGTTGRLPQEESLRPSSEAYGHDTAELLAEEEEKDGGRVRKARRLEGAR